MRRYKMSRRKSKSQFRKKSIPHKKNRITATMFRGGYRL